MVNETERIDVEKELLFVKLLKLKSRNERRSISMFSAEFLNLKMAGGAEEHFRKEHAGNATVPSRPITDLALCVNATCSYIFLRGAHRGTP